MERTVVSLLPDWRRRLVAAGKGGGGLVVARRTGREAGARCRKQ